MTALLFCHSCRYHRHRFPVEIISHCLRLYFRFTLSFRDVEEMLEMREVSLSLRPCERGVLSSARLIPTACDADLCGPVTGGTLMKCSSRSHIHYLSCRRSGWRRIGHPGPTPQI